MMVFLDLKSANETFAWNIIYTSFSTYSPILLWFSEY